MSRRAVIAASTGPGGPVELAAGPRSVCARPISTPATPTRSGGSPCDVDVELGSNAIVAATRRRTPRRACRCAGCRPGRTDPRPRTGCATRGRSSGRVRSPRGRSVRNCCSISGSSPLVGSSSSSTLGSARERGDERDLLAVALRVGAGPFAEVELEPLDQLAPVGLVDAALESSEQREALLAGEPRPEADVAGHVREVMVHLLRPRHVDAR